MNTTKLKTELNNLSNKAGLSECELLNLLLENADESTLLDTITDLNQSALQRTLINFFENKGGVYAQQDPNDYPDEWRIKLNYGEEMHIEIADRQKAVNNEIDFIDDPQEKNDFLKEMAEAADPVNIGAYTRIEQNLYYKEF